MRQEKVECHTITNGLGQMIDIIWRGPGLYAQTAERRIVKVTNDEMNSRHFGTAFWRNSPEEIKQSF